MTKAGLLAVCATALVFTLPAIGQQGPESLLPPGFGDPPPPPETTRLPTGDPAVPVGTTPGRPDSSVAGAEADGHKDKSEDEEEEDEEEEELVIRYDVPPAARRSLTAVGIISPAAGGFPADAFGRIDGGFLKQALRRTSAPLASRWGMIMARRLMASRTETPSGIDGADWTAERAWLLLRMGDSVVARQLVQQVDADRYSKRLLQVSMQTFLANGDLSAMCPLSENGVRMVSDGSWKMSRSICASLAGDQGNATALLTQGRNQGWVKGVDYLLTEKAVGAGINGRRSVKIEWEDVTGINSWRFGLSAATGLEAPDRLYSEVGRHIDGWRVQLPMFGAGTRAKTAPGAAALGVLSNRDMVDLYAQVLDDPDAPDAAKERAENLALTYTGSDDAARISAMTGLWDGATPGVDYQGMLVLTARAAALIRPASDHAAAADRLVASMMTAGLDRSAAAWTNIVEKGSLAWALLAVGAPGRHAAVQFSPLNDFYSNDNSSNGHKSALLLAGLAGLGRIDTEAQADFGGDLGVNVTRQTAWSRAISAAADRGESGTVALLALAGLQSADWTLIPANHLYYIVRSLRQVGLEAEARMIAAEAVTFG
ncbi:MAG: hypothetical protein ABI668_11550 [Sphingorhabdus sp.]